MVRDGLEEGSEGDSSPSLKSDTLMGEDFERSSILEVVYAPWQDSSVHKDGRAVKISLQAGQTWSQGDNFVGFAPVVEEVWDKTKDFRGDLINRGRLVSPETKEVKNLEDVLLYSSSLR